MFFQNGTKRHPNILAFLTLSNCVLTLTKVTQLTQHISDYVNIQNIMQAYLHTLSFLSNTIHCIYVKIDLEHSRKKSTLKRTVFAMFG